MRSIGVVGFLLAAAGFWLLPSVLAGRLASSRGGNGVLWSIIALVCIPFSWLVVVLAVSMNHHKLCVACRMRIDRQASLCPYCRTPAGTGAQW